MIVGAGQWEGGLAMDRQGAAFEGLQSAGILDAAPPFARVATIRGPDPRFSNAALRTKGSSWTGAKNDLGELGVAGSRPGFDWPAILPLTSVPR
ncbi:hypothetical protein SAMN04488094_108174 [Tropicimonas isoalkanivorans]|uniref:Uncharacterized protein n=1 Tax=Tropicimonas isoalkanivorans TaxID=441112 RepID=A0A1I1LKJ3_9RHOB|nr:hypothetical protein SAMN04488094_108174 [Tropicimonas isoalkanivorans]